MPLVRFSSLVFLLGVSLAWAGRVDGIVSLPNQPSVLALRRDPAGNLYIGGSVAAASPRSQYDTDAFVAKLSADGSQLLFWTTLSGSQGDVVTAMAITPAGSVLVAGSTQSSDFPVTQDAAEPQKTAAENSTGFFARLDASGNVAYASYLNFSGYGFGPSAVTTDGSGAAYITGSGSLASTPGALPTMGSGGYFVVKLDAAGKQVFATGGIGGTRIALDAQGSIYVAGEESGVFPLPVTPGAFQANARFSICSSSGGFMGFQFPCSQQYVAKLDPAATKLVYATWLTGSIDSAPSALLVDGDGNAILAGSTGSPDYPVTAGAFQTENFATLPPVDNTYATLVPVVIPPPNTGYVTKLNATGTRLVFSTLIGGSGQDVIDSMATDAEGNFYLAGVAGSPDFSGLNGVPDGCRPNYLYPVPFLTRLSADGATLTSTQLAFGMSSLGTFFSLSSIFDGHGKAVLGLGSLLATLDLFAPTPQLACVVDAADLAPLAQVAPGQLVTLFGRGLGLGTGVSFQPKNGHVPTSLGDGVSVLIHGIPAPILYSSANQVNVQVPYEIAGQSAVKVEIQRSGTSLGSRQFAVVASQPSVFVAATEYATCHQTITNSLLPVAHNADGSRNSCDNPAAEGSTVTFFVNGLGLAGDKPSTGAIATPPAMPSKLPIKITGDAALVSAETDPGSVNSVWAVKVKLGSEAAASGGLLSRFTLTIGGVPLRDQLVMWTK